MAAPLSDTSNSNNFVVYFRNFARNARKPQPYSLGTTECKGICNIIIGLGQILVCPYFKCYKKHLYPVHLNAGKIAIIQGLIDLRFAIPVTLGIGIATRRWT